MLILIGSYETTALLFRDRYWPRRWMSPSLVFVTTGLSDTVFSEWLNTSPRSSWQYAEAMPQVHGIGLTPLLQWLVIPPLLVLLLRRRYAT